MVIPIWAATSILSDVKMNIKKRRLIYLQEIFSTRDYGIRLYRARLAPLLPKLITYINRRRPWRFFPTVVYTWATSVFLSSCICLVYNNCIEGLQEKPSKMATGTWSEERRRNLSKEWSKKAEKKRSNQQTDCFPRSTVGPT